MQRPSRSTWFWGQVYLESWVLYCRLSPHRPCERLLGSGKQPKNTGTLGHFSSLSAVSKQEKVVRTPQPATGNQTLISKPSVQMLAYRQKMLDAVKWRQKVPGRTRFQMRSLQWFRGCLPWHWSPVWSSPGNKWNQKSVGRFYFIFFFTEPAGLRSKVFRILAQAEAADSPLCTPLQQPCRGLSESLVNTWWGLCSSWWGCLSL